MISTDKNIQSINKSFDTIRKIAEKVSNPSTPLEPRDMVDLMVSEKRVEANTKVIKTTDDMIGTLINIKA